MAPEHHTPNTGNAHAPRSVCILRLSAIGDVTHVVPLIRSMQAQWPDTAITWIVGRREAELVGDLPGVECLVFDKRGGRRAWQALRLALRDRRFDVLLHMQVALRANLLSTLVRARTRLGYDRRRSRDLHGWFINQRVPWIHGQHVLELFQTFGHTMGLAPQPVRWDIPVPEEAQAFAREHIPDDQPTLLVSPCSSHPLRDWRPERYAAVADHAVRRHRMRVILCGGPGERERRMGDAIQHHMQETPVDLIGRDTLKGMLALLERSAALLAPDSGPAHMGAATGTPVLGLYAASNPRRSGPWGSVDLCLNKYDQAARIYRKKAATELRWGTKLEYPGVMDLIRPEEVCGRLDELARREGWGTDA